VDELGIEPGPAASSPPIAASLSTTASDGAHSAQSRPAIAQGRLPCSR
jgi:hypothetical protein